MRALIYAAPVASRHNMLLDARTATATTRRSVNPLRRAKQFPFPW